MAHAATTAARRLLGSAGRRVVDPRPTAPSYSYKTEELARLEALGLEFGVRHPVWGINDKDDARAWAERLGLRQPQLLGRYESADLVPWAALPDRVVLKPTEGAAGRGVLLLQREGEAWRELRTRHQLTTADVEERLAGLAAAGKTSATLIAEELVEDPRRPGRPPVDWKVVTFFGRVGVVQAKAWHLGDDGRPSAAWRFFDEDWNDLGRAKAWRDLDPTIEPPLHAEELLATARRVSSAVPRAMLRVDLYDAVDGVVFGEITPAPGGAQRYRRDLDHHLGALWEEAEARLQVRAAAASALTPGERELPESASVMERPSTR